MYTDRKIVYDDPAAEQAIRHKIHKTLRAHFWGGFVAACLIHWGGIAILVLHILRHP